MSRAPPSDGQTAAEKHSGGEKCFPQVRCTQERGSADGKTEAVLAEHVRQWRPMGKEQCGDVERQEPRAGPGRTGEEDAGEEYARRATGLATGAEMQ